MVTGALRRNKRMRRSNIDEKLKVKNIIIRDTSFESLHSKFNNGCNIILEGVLDKKLLIYDSNMKDKEIYLIAKSQITDMAELVRMRFYNSGESQRYEVVSHHGLSLKLGIPAFYEELNKKAQRML